MKLIYLTLLSIILSLKVSSQSFKNVNELISFSRKTPSDLEKKLSAKGFKYLETKNNRQHFSNSEEGTALNYELNPRILEFSFKDRQFYLDAYSNLEKTGYIISKGELITIGSGKKYTADKFSSMNNELYFFQYTESSKVIYEILVYPKVSNGGTILSDKEDFGYGCLYISLLTPKGLIADVPSPSNSVEQSFLGKAGIGAGRGWEFGLSGISGLYGVNKKLPYFIDFGLHLKLMAGFQTFALASTDYNYKNFIKLGGGGGPSITISPLRERDLRFSFYYDFIPSASMGGSVEYKGPNQNYSKKVARVGGSFAMIKVYGFEVKYKNISFALESSKYIDKGKYENESGTSGNVTKSKFDAAIQMNQMALKMGYCFQ